jgi:hypothetical protein
MGFVHLGLDLLGLIPVVGEAFDGINAVIYLIEGDYVNAGLSASGMIPGIGAAATGAKLAYKTINKATDIAGAARKVAGSEDDLVRVGRWMSPKEHAEMVRTGVVQVSPSGTTHVAYPASPGAFGTRAERGSLYVEFDVPRSSVHQAGRIDWGQIPSPNHPIGRLQARRGTPVQSPVPVCNIVVLASC